MVKFKFCLMLSATLLAGACGQTDDTSTEASTLIATAQASGMTASPASLKNSSEMPEAVRKWVEEKAQECRTDGNKFKGISDAVRKFEFNGDGTEDYALWEGGLACEGRDAGYFGNAGGQVSFVVSEKGSHKLHDGFSIFGWDAWNVQKKSGKDVIKTSGTKGDQYLEVTWSWDGWEISSKKQSWAIGPTMNSSAYRWTVEEEVSTLYAGYGTPDGEYDYVLECNRGKSTISLSSGDAGVHESDFVELDVNGENSFVGKTTITQDTEYYNATIAISARNQIYTDLIAGESPLRVKWNKWAVDELINGPKLQGFLTKCRERALS